MMIGITVEIFVETSAVIGSVVMVLITMMITASASADSTMIATAGSSAFVGGADSSLLVE